MYFYKLEKKIKNRAKKEYVCSTSTGASVIETLLIVYNPGTIFGRSVRIILY